MTKKKLIDRTVKTLEKLPEDKVHEVADYADFVFKKYEEKILQKGLEALASQSKSFEFLQDEEELYDENDLIEKY
ncbi:hypothetical protein [Rhodohalobacter sp.]|uniref:hypothetical protein n=1 Tax=Rhodohalobacter sp. TaxID=1974210 RepID=UPI002ACD38A1|nr:hypothetical protein [Rhodohalobacter sp.]MDZ7756523.1 hypothetical protein [Rhodohalobacter sp.]